MDDVAPVQVVPDSAVPDAGVSLADAAALLSKTRAAQEAPPKPIKTTPAVEDPEPDEPDGADPSDTEEIDLDGDNEEEGAEPTPSLNPPPKSWSEADKELWDGLTPEVQQKLLTREKQRETGIQKQLTKAQQDQKAWAEQKASEEAQIKTERQQLNAALQNTQAGIINRLNSEFADVNPRDPASLQKLALDDPGRKVLFDTLWHQLGSIGHQARQIEDARNAETQAEAQKFAAERVNQLLELDSSLADEGKQKEFETQVIGYLSTDNRVSADRINMYTAAELILARKAMLYDKAIAARKAREKAGAEGSKAVLKAGQPRDVGKSQKVTALEKQVRKSGSVKDALALYKAQRAS